MRFRNSGLNHHQLAWLGSRFDAISEGASNTQAAAELQAFLSLGEVTAGAFSNLDDPKDSLRFRPVLRGIAIGQERFKTAEEAIDAGEKQRLEWIEKHNNIRLPKFLLNTQQVERAEFQCRENLIVTPKLDLKNFYVSTGTEIYDGFSSLSVLEWIAETEEYPQLLDDSIKPLFQLAGCWSDNADIEDTDVEEVAYQWKEAGYYGHIVLARTPIREYHADKKGYSFSFGRTKQQYFYVDDINDTSRINAWLADLIAEWKNNAPQEVPYNEI